MSHWGVHVGCLSGFMVPSANGGTYATGTSERRDRSSASDAEMSAIPVSQSERSSRFSSASMRSASSRYASDFGKDAASARAWW